MEESTSKEKVLKKIRNALISQIDNPYPNVDFEKGIYHEINDPLDIAFAEEFTRIGGRFVYCMDTAELVANLKALQQENNWGAIFCKDESLKDIFESGPVDVTNQPDAFLDIKAGMTRCEALVARFGTVMVSSDLQSGRQLNVYPEVHLVVATTNQLVAELKDAIHLVKEQYGEENIPSMMTMVSGPSRTADIEKTLVLGAHGPKQIYVFLVDSID